MQSHKRQILFGVIVVTLVIAFVYATRENDPVYEGKRLSEHLQRLQGLGISFGGVNSSPPDGRNGPSVTHSDDLTTLYAIDAVGTNALPMLTRMLSTRDSRIKIWIQSMADQHKVIRRFIPDNRNRAWARQIGGLVAFSRLGPQAATAIPDIIPLLNDPDTAMSAMVALRHIRPEREKDILSLTNVFRIQTLPRPGGPVGLLPSSAILVLSTFGNKASNTTPLLIECLTSTNEYIHSSAAVALARLGAAPEKMVPLIIANLSKINPPPLTFLGPGGPMSNREQLMMSAMNVQLSIWALGEYGHHASNALPILSILEQHPISEVKRAARAATAKIRGDTNSISR